MEKQTALVLLVLIRSVIMETNPFPECDKSPADVMFLLDGSGSVGEQRFNLIKEFVEDLVRKMNIGENATSVGLVQFSGGEKTAFEFRMNDYQDTKSVINAVRKIKYDYGNLQETGEAMKAVSTKVFNNSKENKIASWKKSVVVLIAEGPSTYQDKAVREAEILKNRGVNIVSIGVGNRISSAGFIGELNDLASSPQNVFLAKDDNLMTLVRRLGPAICPTISLTKVLQFGPISVTELPATHTSVSSHEIGKYYKTQHVTIVHTSTKVITSYLLKPSSCARKPLYRLSSKGTETNNLQTDKNHNGVEIPQFSGKHQVCYSCEYDDVVAKEFTVECQTQQCSASQPYCADAILELSGRRFTKKTCASEANCNSTLAQCVNEVFKHVAEFTDCRVECCDGKLCNPYSDASFMSSSILLCAVFWTYLIIGNI